MTQINLMDVAVLSLILLDGVVWDNKEEVTMLSTSPFILLSLWRSRHCWPHDIIFGEEAAL